MTREEAKTVLASYRPSRADLMDRKTAEALQFAANDPVLKEWLQQQEAFHASVTAGLRALPVPPDLKAKILAGRVLVPLWQRREWLAIAAAIIFLAAVAALWVGKPRTEATLANFQSRMTSFALRTYRMDVLSSDTNVVRNYLTAHSAPSDFDVPPALKKLAVKGGGRLSWQNQPVAMMCFDLPNNETLYLFVVNESNVARVSAPPVPEIHEGKRLTTATWTTNGKIFHLAGHTDGATLAALAGRNG